LAIVVVGGSGKDVGKTALMCAVIAALREFEWTAVKITGHDYEPAGAAVSGAATIDKTIWEESLAGEETDTGRYLAAGARRALLVARHGRDVPMKEIQNALGEDRNVIFESNRIIDLVRPDVCLALMGAASEMKPSFERLLAAADAVVSVEGAAVGVPDGMRWFRLESMEQLPAEMVEWMRERIDTR
jgi:molybdopterin-guanine dinucleotide biosynthesis protein